MSSELVDVPLPVNLTAEIKKLKAAFRTGKTPERLVHHFGLGPAPGELHRSVERLIVDIECRSHAHGQSNASSRAAFPPRIPSRASSERSSAAMLSSIRRRLPIWCG